MEKLEEPPPPSLLVFFLPLPPRPVGAVLLLMLAASRRSSLWPGEGGVLARRTRRVRAPTVTASMAISCPVNVVVVTSALTVPLTGERGGGGGDGSNEAGG